MRGGHVTDAPTEAARTALQQYLRDLSVLVGLGDWTITVSPEPAEDDDEDEETYLNVTVDRGRRATVRAHARFWGEPPESQRYLSTHELAHLPSERFSEAMDLAKVVVRGRALTMLKKAVENAEEHTTEWIAQRLAPGLPLPPRFG